MEEIKNKKDIRKKVAMFIVPIITIPVLIRTIFYLYVLIKGFGQYEFSNYLSCIINIVMYISILKYAIDYFIKRKDVSIDSLVFRYGISILVGLLNMQNADRIVFILTAIVVFIAPYLSGSIRNEKTNAKLKMFLLFAVLAISFIISFILIKNPTETYVSFLGNNVYNLEVLNTFIEWLLFTVLVLARVIVMIKENKNEVK